MKHAEIKKCIFCKKGMMHNQIPTFYTVKLQRHMLDLSACQRQNGLEQMLGGHALLASVMGPNEDLSKPLGNEFDVWICEDCAQEKLFDLIRNTVFDESDEEPESRIKKLGE